MTTGARTIGSIDPSDTKTLPPLVRASIEHALAHDGMVARRIEPCEGPGTIERVAVVWHDGETGERRSTIVPWPEQGSKMARRPDRMHIEIVRRDGEVEDAHPRVLVIGGPDASEANAHIAIQKGHEGEVEAITQILHEGLRDTVLADAEHARRTLDHALLERCQIAAERARASDAEDAELKVVKRVAEQTLARRVDSSRATFNIRIQCGKVAVTRMRAVGEPT